MMVGAGVVLFGLINCICINLCWMERTVGRLVLEEGMASYVTGHPVTTKEDIRKFKIPINRDGLLPHGFMYLRILDLMGFDNAMIEFAEKSEEIQILIDKILEYNYYQIEEVVDQVDYTTYGSPQPVKLMTI